MEQQNLGVIPFTITDLQSAGAVYTQATTYLNKYRSTQEALLSLAKNEGSKLSKETDDKLMAWQVSAKKAVRSIEDQRKPFTEKAHGFIKAFTAIENTLSKDLYDPIQKIRDASAKIHAEEAAGSARKEREELQRKQKRIDDIAALETQLRNGYAMYLSTVKQTLLAVYANCTLENFNDAEKSVGDFINGSLTEEAWMSISLVGEATLIAEVRSQERFNACSEHFKTEVTKYAEFVLQLFPARKIQLEKGVADNKAAEELRIRQEEEAAASKLAAEKRAEEEAAKAKQQATVTVMVAQANREFDAPRAIESYSVIVSSVDGWRAVIDFYLSNSGTSADDLGKVKLDQMRMFTEKQAKATGEMVDHQDVSYEPRYKAVARATKKKVA